MIDYVHGNGVRPVRFAPPAVDINDRVDGTLLLRSPIPLAERPPNYASYLRDWARRTPDRPFLAARAAGDAGWDLLTYREAWRRASAIGEWLVAQGLDRSRPIAILSSASIEHALLTLAAMAAGHAVSPVSPSYSLIPEALDRLAHVARVLRPPLVFAQDPALHAAARTIPELAAATWIGVADDGDWVPFARLEAEPAGAAFAHTFAAVDPGDIAKILFTSGSTGKPKGVVNTHRMLCAGVENVTAVLGQDEPSVMVDWLPWHHTMGGNCNVGMTLWAGGTLYIDPGKPTPEEFGRTVAALREVSPTVVHNVPTAYQLLADAFDRDADLRDRFFARLRYALYSGAGLKLEVWTRLQAHCVAATGQNLCFLGGYGATEAGPNIATVHWFTEGTGQIGLPVPGVTMKLVPEGTRYEVRLAGPNITPGYLGDAAATAAAFDEEGFYRTGDAVTFVDPDHPAQGLLFAGRAAEDFKLANGAWVAAGALRARLLAATAPWVQDLLVAGHDRDDIRVLLWPSREACDLSGPDRDALLREAIAGHNVATGGASTHSVAGFAWLNAPPSFAAGELTDKGSINQRVALACRATDVAALYAPTADLG